MKCRCISIVIVFSTLISSCTIVPGSKLTTIDKTIVTSEEKDLASKFEVYPITIELLNKLSQPNLRPVINQELDSEINEYMYFIGKADVLNIVVYEHDELTLPAGSFRSSEETGRVVKEDGTIYFPYIGRVSVIGKSVEQVRQLITRKLGKYIDNPFVDVSVAGFNSQKVFITGEVNNPTTLNITNIPLTLLSAVTNSGGVTEQADWSQATLIRADGKEEILSLESLIKYGVLTENRLLHNNDIVYVPNNDKRKIFVLGEVVEPSSLPMSRVGMKLTEALGLSGGIDETSADAKGIFVIRKNDSDSDKIATIYQLDLSDASSMVLGASFALEPFDIVYVTAAPLTLWNRVVNQLLPTLNVYDLLNSNFEISVDRAR